MRRKGTRYHVISSHVGNSPKRGPPALALRFGQITPCMEPFSPADTIHHVPLEGSSYYLEIFVGTLVAVCICTFGVIVLQFAL